MIERIVGGFLESPSRRWIVAILTFVVTFAAVWPAADEYFALRSRRFELERELAELRQTAAGVNRLARQVQNARRELESLLTGTVSAERLHRFRGEVVEWVRQSGCQTRRIEVGDRRAVAWKAGALPFEPPADLVSATESRPTERLLVETQSLRLSVVGPLRHVKELLARLHATGKLLHTRQLTLGASGADRKLVLLDLDVLLFDVKENQGPPA